MKIGIDATALYGRFGGVEYALWNLLDALREVETPKLPHQWIVYLPFDGTSAERWGKFGVNWRFVRLPFRGGEKARRIAWQQTQLAAQARRDGCDILHCPTYVCPLRASLPIVLTIYDFIALTHPHFATPLNRAHYGWLLPRCARRADRIIVPSDMVRREIVRRVPAAQSKTHVVPLAVESSFSAQFSAHELEAARARLQLPPRFILFVGNPEPKKNVPAIVEAMRHLPPEVRGIPLAVTGGARAWKGHHIGSTYSVAPNAHALATLSHSEPQTLALGYVAREDLPLLYALCDAFVFPSLAEGFGLPVLEALAGGAPVLCSNRVPLPHLETVALISEPHDTSLLSSQLAQVLQDTSLREKMRSAGRIFAQNYSWQHTAQMTLDVYASLGK